MPTYGYQCTQCKHEFQAFQAMKDDPIRICPQCDGAVKRLLYPVGVVFKGSGWYINDSRKPEPTSNGTESDTASSKAKPESQSGETTKPVEKLAGDAAPATAPAVETKSSSEQR
jgi:putative FmdB family regulatory protein